VWRVAKRDLDTASTRHHYHHHYHHTHAQIYTHGIITHTADHRTHSPHTSIHTLILTHLHVHTMHTSTLLSRPPILSVPSAPDQPLPHSTRISCTYATYSEVVGRATDENRIQTVCETHRRHFLPQYKTDSNEQITQTNDARAAYTNYVTIYAIRLEIILRWVLGVAQDPQVYVDTTIS
jgi:hypothetical protein